ncbi:UNVERIFIED_CONTAM: hypothetical protein PYX00_000945 [Menopon gallinae]|uniref:Uncharacterized protein n=1 Tax=Menopon gallinae TaxID=328185 RepID=A0AAW2IC84_9NEOP
MQQFGRSVVRRAGLSREAKLPGRVCPDPHLRSSGVGDNRKNQVWDTGGRDEVSPSGGRPTPNTFSKTGSVIVPGGKTTPWPSAVGVDQEGETRLVTPGSLQGIAEDRARWTSSLAPRP